MKTSKTLVVLALTLSFATAYAQSDEQVLNSAPIDVDGYLAERQATDGELEQIKSEIRKQKNEVQLNKEKTKGFRELTKTTEKLSETTEEYIDEKKTTQKEIAEYNKKIKCLMEETPGKDCDKYIRNRRNDEVVEQKVEVAQAAPISVSTAEVAPAAFSDSAFERIGLGLEGGVTNYSGDKESLRADRVGLRLESNINSRFSMSVGGSYTAFETEDFANNMFGGQNWQMPYYNNYGMKGRNIKYSSMGLDIGGKFYLVNSERFRPYLGAGIGYNMASLKYTQNNPYQYGMYRFGNEDFKTNFATGSVSIGADVMITRMFGLNIQGAYSRGLGDSLSSENGKNMNTNPDQRRLNQLGDEVINANALSLTAALMVVF